MADESLEAIQQLRAAIEEQGREIQRLVQRHTQLEQQLHGLGRRGQEALQPEPKAPESHLPGRGNGPRLSLESVKSATPAKAGALPPVAEPLSKRLAKAMPQLRESQESAPSAQPKEGRDVCLDAIDLLDDLPEEAIDEDRQENEDDDIEVQMDVENSRISPPTSFTATFRSWDSLAALLQSAGFRTTMATAFTCLELSRAVKDAAFAFRQWFPSRVLVMGGVSTNPVNSLSSTEVFDPRHGSWEAGPSLLEPRGHAAVVCSAGVVYVIGGKDGHRALASVEEYCAETHVWRSAPALATPRWGAAARQLGSQVFVMGGCSDTETLRSCEKLPSSTADDRCWQTAPPLIQRRAHSAAAVLDGALFVMGGSTGSEMTWTAERLDVEASCWTIEKVLPQVPVRLGATLVWSIQGLVSIGGVLGGQSCPTACTECLTLQRHGATLWLQIPSWRIPRLAPAVITSCEGNIFVMGGSHKKEASNFTEMWVQEQQCWRELPPMLAAREGAFAAVLR